MTLPRFVRDPIIRDLARQVAKQKRSLVLADQRTNDLANKWGAAERERADLGIETVKLRRQIAVLSALGRRDAGRIDELTGERDALSEHLSNAMRLLEEIRDDLRDTLNEMRHDPDGGLVVPEMAVDRIDRVLARIIEVSK